MPVKLLKKGMKGEEVKHLQRLLQKNLGLKEAKFRADGDFGKLTDKWTRVFQKKAKLSVDGKVGPATFGALAKKGDSKSRKFAETIAKKAPKDSKDKKDATPAKGSASTEVTFDPKGKTFSTRIEAMKAHAKTALSFTVKEQSGKRGADWQQKYHVAHMFAYNGYNSKKPAITEKGGKTISFDHASNPKTMWKKVKRDDFLRTKAGGVPKLKEGDWQKGSEPDKDATIKHIKSMLKKAGIGKGGKAMVSAGIKGCGEPCKCKVGTSKHLTGEAVDLQMSSITGLASKLKSAKSGSLDDYLKKFGLDRPLKKHPKSPEPWHLESL